MKIILLAILTLVALEAQADDHNTMRCDEIRKEINRLETEKRVDKTGLIIGGFLGNFTSMPETHTDEKIRVLQHELSQCEL